MGLWNEVKKIFTPSPQQQEPAKKETPSADLLRKDIEYATSAKFILVKQLVLFAPLREALRDALLQKLDEGKLDRLMWHELAQKCWFLIAQKVRDDYAEARKEVRAAMARGNEHGRKVQNAKEDQILSSLILKLDKTLKFQEAEFVHGVPSRLYIKAMRARFFTLPEADNFTDNLILTRAILRDFLPQYFAGQLTDFECEIRFLTLLTEQARGLAPQDLLENSEVTQVFTDTTGMSEEEEKYYLQFYEITKSYVRRWNTQEWSYFLAAWYPFS